MFSCTHTTQSPPHVTHKVGTGRYMHMCVCVHVFIVTLYNTYVGRYSELLWHNLRHFSSVRNTIHACMQEKVIEAVPN